MKSAAATLTLAVLLCPAGFAQERAGDPPESTAARRTTALALTPTEYNNTVADLLGFPRDGERWPPRPPLADTLSPRRAASKGVFLPPPPPPVWPWRFPSEPGAGGFEGIAQGQSPSSYQIEELHLAAMHFASFALLSPTFFTCGDWAALPAAEQKRCTWASIERFAERAWRRPLEAEERERIETFWRTNLAAGPAGEAVALTVAGVLSLTVESTNRERTAAATSPATCASCHRRLVSASIRRLRRRLLHQQPRPQPPATLPARDRCPRRLGGAGTRFVYARPDRDPRHRDEALSQRRHPTQRGDTRGDLSDATPRRPHPQLVGCSPVACRSRWFTM